DGVVFPARYTKEPGTLLGSRALLWRWGVISGCYFPVLASPPSQDRACLPGGADPPQEPAIEPDPACRLPGQDQPGGDGKQQCVARCSSRHHVVPIHE